MEQPPINHETAKDILGSLGTWIMWFISSIISGSVSAIMRAGTIKVAAYWVVLSTMVGPGLAVIAVVYWESNVFIGAVVCVGVGLMIAGIAGQIERLNKRVGDASLPKILTMLLAFWAKMSASKASRLAGEAKESTQATEAKVDVARMESKRELSEQTATLMAKIPEKVVEVAKDS